MAKKTKHTDEQKAILADLKKREKKDVYGQAQIDIPYSMFEEWVENIQQMLYENDLEKTTEEIMLDPAVRAEYDRLISEIDFSSFDGYGVYFDFEDFALEHFGHEIDAATRARELEEEEEERKYEEEQERLAAERRAKMQQIDVAGENYDRALAVLRAAGLIK